MLQTIRSQAAADDFYGFYGGSGSALWWWRAGSRQLHILGEGDILLLFRTREDERCDIFHPDVLLCLIGAGTKISRIVIHEGIRRFVSRIQITEMDFSVCRESVESPLMNPNWHFEADELVLPSTLDVMPLLKSYVDHMTVPESVRSIVLSDLWVECGGHSAPVSFAIRSLCLPSTIEIHTPDDPEEHESFGFLPLLEPIGHWEEIVLYGEKPIPDLGPWYASNVFLTKLEIRYPAAWDEGADCTFSERVTAYVRSQTPQYGELAGMDAARWHDWGEAEYEQLKKRIRPYRGLPHS